MCDSPVFLISNRAVPSYGILYELAALSGFPICNTCHEREEGRCYIKTMYHPLELSGYKGKVVLWFLERPSISGGIEAMSRELESYKKNGMDEIWVSDRYLSDTFKGIVKFVPIGSHEGLAITSDLKSYDIVDMSYRDGRRRIIDSIGCRVAPNTYDSSRATILSNTKFLLNIHQFEDQCSEPLRFALAAAAGIPIISETCHDPYPYEAPGMVQVSYEEIVWKVRKLLREDYEPHKETGMRQRDRILKDFHFRDNVLKALAETTC